MELFAAKVWHRRIADLQIMPPAGARKSLTFHVCTPLYVHELVSGCSIIESVSCALQEDSTPQETPSGMYFRMAAVKRPPSSA